MFIGYIVGIIVAVAILVAGVVGMIQAKRNGVRSKWAVWAIAAGVVALISAVVNYNIFS